MSKKELLKEQDYGDPQSFEQLWGNKTADEDLLNQSNTSRQTDSSSHTGSPGPSPRGRSDNKLVLSPREPRENFSASFGSSPRGRSDSSLGVATMPKVKKSKLEKIHELQAQCDRYSIELHAIQAERQTYLRELNDYREESASLKKIVDAHEEKSNKLQSRLAEVEEELESTRVEQQKDRKELSEAAKGLAMVNIDYAKCVDEARIMKEKLDGLQNEIEGRDKKMSILEKDLETSNENVSQLEADVLYADDQIGTLEAEIKRLEDEVALYTEAANRDENEDGDGKNHLLEAKIEAEKRKCEEREKELEEKNRKLEEKSKGLEEDTKEFERQKSLYLEQHLLKEKEFEERRAREEAHMVEEEHKIQTLNEDRLKTEEELKQRLNELEDENIALKGRLKSEQLDSTMQIQNKENTIAELESEVAKLTKEQEQRDSAPDSSPSLLSEIEDLKAEATKRKLDFDEVCQNKIDLENEVEGLQHANIDITTRLCNFESEMAQQKKEIENQRRKTLEWQKKTGEWSEKAVMWKQRSEHWEKKAKDTNSDAATTASSDSAQVEPQALFLAAAVEKKATNVNGSWTFGRKLFGGSSDNDDETQALITKLEGENSSKEVEIKTLKSEMVKMQTNYKEQAYSQSQELEKLLKEKEAIELKNETLLKELELARKLNRTISDSAI